ncbi:MAG TPA: hypothetical protein DCQ31_13710 [Bacteroidales bacterium]|nr:hypothetical protein [Bacteroidales bacterium]
MKKKLFILFAVCLTAGNLFAQKTMTLKQLKADYDSIFSVYISPDTTDGNFHVSPTVNRDLADSTNLYYNFIADYQHLIGQTIGKSPRFDGNKYKNLKGNLPALRKIVADFLQNSEEFNTNFLPYAVAYLSSKNIKVKGYTNKKQSISLNELQIIASKYFYVHYITEKGNLGSHICGVWNPYFQEPEYSKNPMMEAFAINTIFNAYKIHKQDVMSPFWGYVRTLNAEYNKITDEQERIEKAKQAGFKFMETNEVLKQVLIDEYKRLEKGLPFVVVM